MIMQTYLKRLPADIRNALRLMAHVSAARGVSAYLVGGVVRDLLLKRPIFDLDIVVVGDAVRIAEAFARHSSAKLIRHRRFQTATVVLASGGKVDFASARKETYPHPGSLPIVRPGSLEDDLYRRDFTINTMAVELTGKLRGQLVDYYRGREDLRRKSIRVLHDLSFVDDPTRIMRAIRFEQRFGFRIEPHTVRLLKSAVAGGMLGRVSPQRLRNELILLLKEQDPFKPLSRLHALGGLGFIGPGFAVTGTTRALFARLRRQVAWFADRVTSSRIPEPWLLYCMALFDHLSDQRVKGLCETLALGSHEQQSIVAYKRSHAAAGSALGKRGLRPSQVYTILSPFDDAVILMLRARYRAAALQKYTADYLSQYKEARTATSGEDLKTLGLAPGPGYQALLRAVLHARLDGIVRTAAQELAYVKKSISGR